MLIRSSRHAGSGRCGFLKVVAPFLADNSLPFARFLSARRIERAFAKHDGLFGLHGVYSTAITLWAFLSQVLRDGKEASCRAAVARVVTHCGEAGANAPSSDTGEYCRARRKLSEGALRDLTCGLAGELEASADDAWLWKGKHAKLVDGFTFTMPDSDANQAEYPQAKTQKPGLGQPIARAAAVLSLATGCVLNATFGRYSGKKTGETALLRNMLDSFSEGDVAVMDRYYCSFMMIALLLSRGVQTCMRKHHMLKTEFRRGKRLGKNDHLLIWIRPQRPSWMDKETYARIPDRLVLREISYRVIEPGCRTKRVDVITTLTNPEEYSAEEIAELYGFRWNSELDIRSIKDSLNLGHLRCKSPKMIRLEFWTTLLAYNLIRTTAAGAALLHGKQPRSISFTGACQYVLASWMLFSCGLVDPTRACNQVLRALKYIAQCKVANRPGRFEPRVLKQRPKPYPIMTKPRTVLRDELRNQRD